MASREEQETVISWLRGDKARIYTAYPPHLRRLRAEDRAIELRGGEDWAEFEVEAGAFNPLTGFKRKTRPMTEEERQAASDRLRKAREAR